MLECPIIPRADLRALPEEARASSRQEPSCYTIAPQCPFVAASWIRSELVSSDDIFANRLSKACQKLHE